MKLEGGRFSDNDSTRRRSIWDEGSECYDASRAGEEGMGLTIQPNIHETFLVSRASNRDIKELNRRGHEVTDRLGRPQMSNGCCYGRALPRRRDISGHSPQDFSFTMARMPPEAIAVRKSSLLRDLVATSGSNMGLLQRSHRLVSRAR